MHHTPASILHSFDTVRVERERRRCDQDLDDRVLAVKRYQQRRFLTTYADLLADPRHAQATRFFLEEVYGPRDFSRRDRQFCSLVPTLTRIFPQRVVDTIGLMGELHALTEVLDSRVAEAALPCGMLDARGYLRAWQRGCRPEERETQLRLVLAVGESLDAHTRVPLLRQSLQWVQRPAEAAGFGELHRMLLAGYDSFRAMGSARDFLQAVAQRERRLAARLFAADAEAALEAGDAELGQLP
ncbi:FFLEELY motif protein [Caldimonas tepidiphila]|uniref:FFLEELY motif protein n=1 Tax=Caldimonas tepidiphila TaxID=2315841 RepID=UPI000E5A2FF5|nr:hypothetical protein [Caldimonas tepidiphila]